MSKRAEATHQAVSMDQSSGVRVRQSRDEKPENGDQDNLGDRHQRDQQIEAIVIRVVEEGEDEIVLGTDAQGQHLRDLDPLLFVEDRHDVKGSQSQSQ